MNVLAVLVNYGEEQLDYLQEVVKELKSFSKYKVTVIVNSNIDLSIANIDKVNVITLEDYEFLPLTCREVIWKNRDNYDIFLYGENDHLFKEKHLDRHIEYSHYMPKNRLPGLIQYEEDTTGKYYPAYHLDFEWDFNSVEVYEGKKFAYFSNIHQATFILTKDQLMRVSKKIDFTQLIYPSRYAYRRIKRKIKQILGFRTERLNKYSNKCKVNTDVFEFGGMKKLICISDFEDNLIHHLPNIYIRGIRGRNKLRSDDKKMKEALKRLL